MYKLNKNHWSIKIIKLTLNKDLPNNTCNLKWDIIVAMGILLITFPLIPFVKFLKKQYQTEFPLLLGTILSAFGTFFMVMIGPTGHPKWNTIYFIEYLNNINITHFTPQLILIWFIGGILFTSLIISLVYVVAKLTKYIDNITTNTKKTKKQSPITLAYKDAVNKVCTKIEYYEN